MTARFMTRAPMRGLRSRASMLLHPGSTSDRRGTASTSSTTGSHIRREAAAVLIPFGCFKVATCVVVLGDLDLPQILALLTMSHISYLPKDNGVSADPPTWWPH